MNYSRIRNKNYTQSTYATKWKAKVLCSATAELYQIEVLQNAEFTDFLMCIFLNNLVKYCIRKTTIFSERKCK